MDPATETLDSRLRGNDESMECPNSDEKCRLAIPNDPCCKNWASCILNAPTNYADILGGLPTSVELLPKLKSWNGFHPVLFEAAIGPRTRLSASPEGPRCGFPRPGRLEDPNRCE
jgi:hypothetical protein